MDRAYQILIDETTNFNLAAFGLDNPPDRVTARYLVMVDRHWRYCSPVRMVTAELLDYRAEWDGDEPDNTEEWTDALADVAIDSTDPGWPVADIVKVDPCCPRWHQQHEASADPASPIEWASFVIAAAYQGDYSADYLDEEAEEGIDAADRMRYESAREDASGNHFV